MKLFDRLEKKLKDIFGKSLIDNYGIFLVLSGVHNNSLTLTIAAFILISYYCLIFSLAYHHAVYVEKDDELSTDAGHYAVMTFIGIIYFLAFRLMASRLDLLLSYLDDEAFSYGDTLDLETKTEILEINDNAIRRKKFIRYGVIFLGGFSILHFIGTPVLSGRLWTENNDRYITRNAIIVKYSLFNLNWYVDMLLDSLFIVYFFIINSAIDIPFPSFAENCCRQLDLLNAALKNVHRRAGYVFELKYGREVDIDSSAQFGECLAICLKETVKHHVNAITCCQKLCRSFSMPVFVVFFTGTILLCDSIIQVTSADKDLDMKIGIGVNTLGDLTHGFMYAYYGERFLRANMDVHELVYGVGWEDSPAAMISYLSIMQSYTKNVSVRLSALGFFDYNFINFKNLISTGYSYFNLLSSTNGAT